MFHKKMGWGQGMNLTFMDGESKIAPLLVQLYESQRLSVLSEDAGHILRDDLTAAICELMGMQLSPREAELVSDVMISILRQAELDFRKALAERLSSLDNVPLRLVMKLAGDEIEVAQPILRKSSALSDLDLVYLIKEHGAPHWQAIAERETVSDQLMNVLVDTGDVQTAVNITNNPHVILNEYALEKIVGMAKHSDLLALPLLRRKEVSAGMAKILYQFVGQEVKKFIEDEYGVEGGEIANAVEEVLLDFVETESDESEFMPTESMKKDAHRQKEKGLLTVKLMLDTLRRGQIRPFIAQFSAFADLGVREILDVIEQASGQGLAIICKACDIEQEDFISIFLLSNRVRNPQQMVELSGMSKAMSYYTKIDKKLAENIIKNSRLES